MLIDFNKGLLSSSVKPLATMISAICNELNHVLQEAVFEN